MTAPGGWESPELLPELGEGQVHLWRIPLEPDPGKIAERACTLSPDEHARANAFRFDRHRSRYILRRGALRILLARYVGMDPASLRFQYSERGKPELERQPAGRRLRFNLSDSEDLALLGVTTDRAIGVDVERVRPIPDMDAIARRHFSAGEILEYTQMDPLAKVDGFYACWTRKEAWIKAIGEGLSRELDGFDVTLSPGVPAKLLRVRGAPDEEGRWSLHDVRPSPGYAGAVAVERAEARVVTLAFE